MTDLIARLRQLPVDTMTALSFFSRLPVPPSSEASDLRRISGAWPLSGLLLAIGPALLFWLCGAADLPNLLGALVSLAALAALTGGLHEDGLADALDGFGGGRAREAKLAIMRDSRIGTYGVLALVFAIAIKASALAAIGLQPGHGALALICVAVLSRALALGHWRATPPARADGLARVAGRPDNAAMAIGAATGAAAAFVLLIAFGAAALIAVAISAAGMALFSRLCMRQIGGHTGDTIGAAQQIAETLMLIGLASGWSPIVWAPVGG